MDIQTIYQETIKFAATKHLKASQTLPGTDLPYVVHLSNVAMEILIASRYSENFDLTLALPVALLHDTLEDTDSSYEELNNQFGTSVAQGVLSLTKNKNLTKADQMNDSLKRIKEQPKEIWSVKLADRITNLQEPPYYWDKSKISGYHSEARQILKELKEGNDYLANRLLKKIEEYQNLYLK